MKTGVSLVLISTIGVLACGSEFRKNPRPKAPPEEYEFSVALDPTQKRFELELVSRSARPICLHAHDWPNALGQLHYAGDHVYVQIADSRCYASDRNLGTCGGPGCVLRINPGDTLEGFIALSEFRCEVDPQGPLELSFSATPRYCR